MSFFCTCNYLAGTKENGEQDYRVGVCTPYAAQSKVLKRILNGHSLKNKIDTGAVHRYQGDEKHVMIMDTPDSHGEYRASIFLDSDHPPCWPRPRQYAENNPVHDYSYVICQQ